MPSGYDIVIVVSKTAVGMDFKVLRKRLWN